MTNALDYKRLAAAAGHAQRLAGYLHGATAYRIYDRSSADMLINDAIKELRDCAAAMGLDVVETLSPQQAHEELLAKRRAEDGEANAKLVPIAELLMPGEQPDGSTTMGFR